MPALWHIARTAVIYTSTLPTGNLLRFEQMRLWGRSRILALWLYQLWPTSSAARGSGSAPPNWNRVINELRCALGDKYDKYDKTLVELMPAHAHGPATLCT